MSQKFNKSIFTNDSLAGMMGFLFEILTALVHLLHNENLFQVFTLGAGDLFSYLAGAATTRSF